MGCGLDSSPAGLRPFARVAKPHFKIKKAATRFPSSPLAPAVWRGRATRQAGGRPGFGRDGALRRPSARAFLSPAGRRFKIPPAKSGKAPAGTSPRNVTVFCAGALSRRNLSWVKKSASFLGIQSCLAIVLVVFDFYVCLFISIVVCCFSVFCLTAPKGKMAKGVKPHKSFISIHLSTPETSPETPETHLASSGAHLFMAGVRRATRAHIPSGRGRRRSGKMCVRRDWGRVGQRRGCGLCGRRRVGSGRGRPRCRRGCRWRGRGHRWRERMCRRRSLRHPSRMPLRVHRISTNASLTRWRAKQIL